MKYNVEMRIKEIYERNPYNKKLVEIIHDLSKKLRNKGYNKIKIMNFCGTHEWTITYYGIRSLVPENIDLIAGPGCPVCITPGIYVSELVDLSFSGYTILTYGDAYKLPGIRGSKPNSLYEAHSKGGDVVVVYSFLDAIRYARENPGKKYVFFAVGFETTMPAVAEPLRKGIVPENLYILSAHRYTPPIMRYLFEREKDVTIHGIIAPGHVSTIIGSNAWMFVPREYGVTTVVSGFEPLDVLTAIALILKHLLKNKPVLINEYRRVVKPWGNKYSLKTMELVYEKRSAYWRGIGIVDKSGGYLREEYSYYDVFKQLGVKDNVQEDYIPGCKCGEVVLGKAKPIECPLFMRGCTPERPYGPCMVSIEGTCRIWAENLPVNIDINI